ncbi:nitroreductase/quinone reductase family protein [Streptomyces sp. NBC_01408]|uniref:nitroreductase/quinone reductase family protein n=1 Tax=Streptomyces sp. NBC_01408 TaxID=2903855 RepID=UPI002252C8D8|nr:nitroreductase/quinone reductase family protein [Streptomyces sp. NBC_01408]MCX4695619.1 nitroreductase family deazaflavin-dependent oxidoreductase [Streptomyces sp. NBC_01408]
MTRTLDALRRGFWKGVGTSRLFRQICPLILPPIDRLVSRCTGGRWMPSSMALSTVLLHTTDRHGRPRNTPLATAQVGQDRFLVMGTNFGRPRHPAWSQDLLRQPAAFVTWHGQTVSVHARQLTAEELHAARPSVLAAVPVFDDYAATSGRDIRVFLITPAHDAHPTQPLPVTWTRPRR